MQWTDHPSEVFGAFSDAAGQPASDYTVIVFSASREYWMANSRRIQAARPGTDGRFSLKNLPPGDYRLAAVSDVEPNEWFTPAFLRNADAIVDRDHAGDGERRQQDLRVAEALAW